MNYRLGILLSCCAVFLVSQAQATVGAEYMCTVRIQPSLASSTDCDDPVTVSEFTPGDEAVLDVNMVGAGGPYRCMTVELTVINPAGWVANIGNSPSNDGFGGDAGDRTDDSELEVRAGVPNVLRLYTNDNIPGPPAQQILRVDQFIGGITKATFEIDASSMHAVDGLSKKNACVRSAYIYRRSEDHIYHIGLNRTIADPNRNGQGVWTANISLSSTPCLCQ